MDTELINLFPNIALNTHCTGSSSIRPLLCSQWESSKVNLGLKSNCKIPEETINTTVQMWDWYWEIKFRALFEFYFCLPESCTLFGMFWLLTLPLFELCTGSYVILLLQTKMISFILQTFHWSWQNKTHVLPKKLSRIKTTFC